MAIRKSFIQFEGKLEGINSYLPRNRDEADGYIIRKNGGPSQKQIAKLPSCEVVRQNNSDFGTSSSEAKRVRMAIHPVTHIADINLAARFTSLCRHILMLDRDHKPGNRMVLFGKFGHLMSGFNLNERYLFDSVIRHPLVATLDRDTAGADIAVPALQPGVNLLLPWQQPVFRLLFSMGAVGDIFTVKNQYVSPEPVSFTTPWYPSQQAIAASTVTLQMDGIKVGKEGCLIIAVGIEMGTIVTDGIVTNVKYAGCGKILLAG